MIDETLGQNPQDRSPMTNESEETLEEETQEATPTEESLEQGDDKSQTPTEDDVERQLKSALAQKAKYKEKYEKIRGVIDEKEETPKTAEKSLQPANEESWKQRMEFLVHNRDYSSEDIAILEKLKSSDETLEESARKYQHIVEANKQKRESENKSLNPSKPASTSSLEKSSNEIASMSDKEFEAYEKEIISRSGNKGI